LLCAVKFRNEMKLTDEVKIIFKNSEGKKEELTITIDKLLDNTKDDRCNNESQNFCDCGGRFEDYLIDEVLVVVSA